MNNDKFLDALMGKMIQIVEFQTNIGLKLNDLEKEIKGIQDSCADIHEAVTNRRIWEK